MRKRVYIDAVKLIRVGRLSRLHFCRKLLHKRRMKTLVLELRLRRIRALIHHALAFGDAGAKNWAEIVLREFGGEK
jgi:hypothetical protein